MTKEISALIFCIVVTSFNIAYGCLNGETKVLKNGIIIYVENEGNVPHGHEFFSTEDEFKGAMKELDSLYKITKDLDYLSDKGILMILLKQYDEAIELYLGIEKM